MKRNVGLIGVCIFIIVFSFIIGRNNGEFGGADDQIEETIAGISADYKPWFRSLWEPPSGEVESLLFSLQAAIGAYFIGYYIGKKQKA